MITAMIPTYNNEDTLAMCLASFGGLADEMVVVDDCSDDGTVDILRSFAEDAPFKFVWEQNDRRKGWVANRQRLLEMATGDILLSTDSDCVLREECITDLMLVSKRLPPKMGYYLSTVQIVGDIFHTEHRVVLTRDPNHAIWCRGGKEKWFSNPTYSEEYLADVHFDEYPGHPPLFHLAVHSDLRMVQRAYARQWIAATGGHKPYIPWLLAHVGINKEEFDEWANEKALHLCLSRGVQRYDPQRWYPYPAVMREELDNPHYRFVYEGDQIVGRERTR